MAAERCVRVYSTRASILEIPGKNLFPETGCPDLDFSWFSFVPTGKCRGEVNILFLGYVNTALVKRVQESIEK
jgi:hypothetical protein